jgi:hypothetical protein
VADKAPAPLASSGSILAAAAGVLAIVGSFLPWALYRTEFLDKPQSPNGFADGEEGIWTLAIGIVILGSVAAFLVTGSKLALAAAGVVAASIAVGIIALVDYQETSRFIEEMKGLVRSTVQKLAYRQALRSLLPASRDRSEAEPGRSLCRAS